MSSKLHHESIYRGREQMDKIANFRLLVCGAGALGSNLIVNACRMGFSKVTVVDRDRVEEQNVGTQVYSLEDVGAMKADILANLIYRDVGEEIEAVSKELDQKNASKLLKDCDLVIDSFDNSIARQIVTDVCRSKNLPCLHMGVNGDYGEVRWNERYIVPSNAGDDICDYPLARNLITLVSAVAGEVVIKFALTGVKENYSITLADLSINYESTDG